MNLTEEIRNLVSPPKGTAQELANVRAAIEIRDRRINGLNRTVERLEKKKTELEEEVARLADALHETEGRLLREQDKHMPSADEEVVRRVDQHKVLIAERSRSKILSIHPAWNLLAEEGPMTMAEIRTALPDAKNTKAFVDRGVEIGILATEGRPKKFDVSDSFKPSDAEEE
jgi:parvulin-like peptidyl-prolyl isomerase